MRRGERCYYVSVRFWREGDTGHLGTERLHQLEEALSLLLAGAASTIEQPGALPREADGGDGVGVGTIANNVSESAQSSRCKLTPDARFHPASVASTIAFGSR